MKSDLHFVPQISAIFSPANAGTCCFKVFEAAKFAAAARAQGNVAVCRR